MNKVIITGKKSKGKSKKSPINKSLEKYKAFLDDKNDRQTASKDKKIIQVKRKIHSPKIKKKETDIRDINDIEKKMMKMKTTDMIIQMPTQNRPMTKAVATKEPTKEPMTKVPASKVHRKNSRSNKRMTHRKKSKVQGRKVSIKSSVFNKSDLDKVESRIKEIRKKKHEDIKKELQDQGIKVSGKSNRLLKDIYLYSKMCNINIQHEK
jgi:hypothetical protein